LNTQTYRSDSSSLLLVTFRVYVLALYSRVSALHINRCVQERRYEGQEVLECEFRWTQRANVKWKARKGERPEVERKKGEKRHTTREGQGKKCDRSRQILRSTWGTMQTIKIMEITTNCSSPIQVLTYNASLSTISIFRVSVSLHGI
jgi:hypothetical protein